jgi:hypothetical protein
MQKVCKIAGLTGQQVGKPHKGGNDWLTTGHAHDWVATATHDPDKVFVYPHSEFPKGEVKHYIKQIGDKPG